MKPDIPREKLPKTGCWALTDAWPNLGAPLVKRGGWNRAWNATADGSYIASVGFAPFQAGYKVMGITNEDKLYAGNYAAATMTSVGTVVNLAHPPVFYRDKVYFLDLDGISAVRSWDGTTLTNAAGSPPTAAVGVVWKDHLVLARTNANPRRVFFSKGGDPATWDTAEPDAGGQTWDMSANVQGMATIKGHILVFEEGLTERLRGNIIPGIVGSDMVREQLFAIGCSDPASVAATDDYVVFANASGIYLTDGSTVVDIAEQASISQGWKSDLSGYSQSWTITGVIYRGYYIVCVMDGPAHKTTYWLDVRRRVAGKLTNVETPMMAVTPIGMIDLAPKIIMGERATNRIADLTSMWTPGASYKNDGDSAAVTWSMETPFFLGRRGLKRQKRLWTSYAMSDASSDNPILTVSYTEDLAQGAYTSLGTLAETDVWKAVPLRINMRSEGFALRVAQSNASSSTKLFSFEVEQMPMEMSRRER
jgi:hypothetical protein